MVNTNASDYVYKGMHNGEIKDPSLKKSRKNRKTHAQRKQEIASRDRMKK